MCWENWECGECGARLRCDEPPTTCPDCGVAGGTFVEAMSDSDLESESGSIRRRWFAAGFDHPSLVAAADRHLPG